ncbi:hypothetical protein O3G_MSEX012060 [Manduca sexta]|uniref:BESS domain-containing protein n=1 Tax=Manduca sexta TaxID=7130 RepID=A0A921ZM59_MANSE|nr:hypothetical protein O3G_MSEX012060 [Manduca sexta]
MHFLDKKSDTNDVLEGQILGNAFQIDSWTQNPKEGSIKVTSSNEDTGNCDIPTTSQCSESRRNVKELHRRRKVQKRRNICTDDKDFKREMLKMFKENMRLMQNDDMAFVCSLLPITQAFNNHQKLSFRSEVLKKAMEIANLNPSHDPLELSHVGTESTEDRDAKVVTILMKQSP